jgi:hypothetical protein
MLQLLPATPPTEDEGPHHPPAPAPPPRLVSLPRWTGWSLAIPPGRAAPVMPDAYIQPPPTPAEEPEEKPFRKKCLACRSWFTEKAAYLYHPCTIPTFPMVLLYDFIHEHLPSGSGRRKCSPFPRAKSRSFTKTVRRREATGKAHVETEFDVERERLRPRVRGECAPGPKPCPWCSKKIERVDIDASVAGSDRKEVRKADGAAQKRHEGSRQVGGADVAGQVRVRTTEDGAGPQSQERTCGDLRVQSQAAREVRDAGIQGVGLDDPALRESQEPELSAVRGARDLGVRALEGKGGVHSVLQGHGGATDAAALPGPEGQQRQLRTRQLSLGYEDRAVEQPPRLSCPHCGGRVSYRVGVGGGHWGWEKYAEGAPSTGVDSERRFVDTGGANHCRPCTWVSCRAHTAFIVNPENGSVKEAYPHLRIWKDPTGPGLYALEALYGSCSLDTADKIQDDMMGGAEGEGVPGLIALMRTAISGEPIGQTEGFTLEQTAKALNLSIERVRQIGAAALQEVRVALRRMESARPGRRAG